MSVADNAGLVGQIVNERLDVRLEEGEEELLGALEERRNVCQGKQGREDDLSKRGVSE